MSDALMIARFDLRHMLRQRETIAWAFIMPLVFFYFIGTVTGGAMGTATGSARVGLALLGSEGSGYLVDQVVARLEAENYAVQRFAPGEDVSEWSRQLTVPLPPEGFASFTDAVLAGEQQVLRFDRRGEGPAVQLDTVRVARAVYAVLADLAVLQASGEPGATGFDELAAMPRSLRLEVVPAGERQSVPSGFEQAVPGNLVLFVLLVLLTSGAVTLMTERREGVLRRLASSPIRRSSVVGGKWLARMALATIQAGWGMVAGAWLFGLDWGPWLPMVALVLVFWAGFVASLCIVLANVTRNESQAAGIGVFATMAMGGLGGCMWPIEITPDWMQTLGHALPSGWVMDAIHRLVSFGQSPMAVLPHVAALLGGALLLGWVATRTFRYQ
jgi:ABC-type Na+ efflux pump permease subunit